MAVGCLLDTSFLIILPFNFDEAVQAAQFAEHLQSSASRSDAGRPAVKVDIALLAQAHVNGIDSILSEDEDTLKRFCDALREHGSLQCHVLLLRAGFDPNSLIDPAVPGLAFPQPPDDED